MAGDDVAYGSRCEVLAHVCFSQIDDLTGRRSQRANADAGDGQAVPAIGDWFGGLVSQQVIAQCLAAHDQRGQQEMRLAAEGLRHLQHDLVHLRVGAGEAALAQQRNYLDTAGSGRRQQVDALHDGASPAQPNQIPIVQATLQETRHRAAQ